MILQGQESDALKVIVDLIKFVGAPAATALGILWLMRKVILPKANGKERNATIDHLDLRLTVHFDQLRDDLKQAIENQHKTSRDDMRNALTTQLLELELGRLRAGDK